MSTRQHTVLFVCLGNICRSPVAKFIFADLVRRGGHEHAFVIDSCGTGHWHVGGPADPRSVAVARAHGLDASHVARQLGRDDAVRFEHILAMDRANRATLIDRGVPAGRVRLMREFDPLAGSDPDVPDPYEGGPEGFELVYAMLERSCAGLLAHLLSPAPGQGG